MYEPREDSFLLQKYVEKYVLPGMKVLDMGTGTGIQAETALRRTQPVVAVDIDEVAVKTLPRGVKGIVSDLFEHVTGQFNLIVFNPPYLPEEKYDDKTLFSAKRGSETTMRFLDQVADHLKKDGVILLISSSLTNQHLIQDALDRNMLLSRKLETIHRFFEDIFVLEIRKSEMLQKLQDAGVSHLQKYSRGKRGVIATGTYKDNKVAVKYKRPSSKAMGAIKREADMLERLNERGIGPTLLKKNKEFLIMEFVEGPFIAEFIENSSKEDILSIIRSILDQLLLLDNLGITKYEMHRPYKHIIVQEGHPVLLDFERARFSRDPKNVTQFCDFLMRTDMQELLSAKGINIDKKRLIAAARDYKKNKDKKKIEEIIFSAGS